jgi:hypothetical protein
VEDGGKYAIVGLKPSRGSTGIRESWPLKFAQANKKQAIMLMTACKEAARSYLPSHVLRGIRNAKRLGNWPKILDGAVGAMYAALSSALNSYLNSHRDQDFLYSLLTMASSRGLQEDINQYDVHGVDICNYFTFAEQGIAVTLRLGDMLLFNPVYQHCVSSCTTSYKTSDFFLFHCILRLQLLARMTIVCVSQKLRCRLYTANNCCLQCAVASNPFLCYLFPLG